MNRVCILIGTVLLSTNLCAEASNGVYIGLGLGATIFTDGGSAVNTLGYLDSFDRDSSGTISTSYSSTGFKVYTGYKFNKVVVVEASYTDYGTSTAKEISSASENSALTIKPISIGVATNLGYNFGENSEFRPFGIIGLSSIQINESGDIHFYDGNQIIAVKLGVGFEYVPTKLYGVSVRISYEGDFFTVQTESENRGIYQQSINIIYLGSGYKF